VCAKLILARLWADQAEISKARKALGEVRGKVTDVARGKAAVGVVVGHIFRWIVSNREPSGTAQGWALVLMLQGFWFTGKPLVP
jgi:dTDP-4-dehydrorhamnose 3,5-epimerase-like enzyme